MPLDQDLVKRNFLGKDGFIWWIGQIPEEILITSKIKPVDEKNLGQ